MESNCQQFVNNLWSHVSSKPIPNPAKFPEAVAPSPSFQRDKTSLYFFLLPSIPIALALTLSLCLLAIPDSLHQRVIAIFLPVIVIGLMAVLSQHSKGRELSQKLTNRLQQTGIDRISRVSICLIVFMMFYVIASCIFCVKYKETLNECNFTPCKNGASCINVPFGFTCDCADGFNGNQLITLKFKEIHISCRAPSNLRTRDHFFKFFLCYCIAHC